MAWRLFLYRLRTARIEIRQMFLPEPLLRPTDWTRSASAGATQETRPHRRQIQLGSPSSHSSGRSSRRKGSNSVAAERGWAEQLGADGAVQDRMRTLSDIAHHQMARR